MVGCAEGRDHTVSLCKTKHTYNSILKVVWEEEEEVFLQNPGPVCSDMRTFNIQLGSLLELSLASSSAMQES